MKTAWALTLFGLLLISSACGGDDDGAGTGVRVSDPALVPSSTPIQNPLTFRVRNDQIEIVGGGTSGGGGGGAPEAKTHTVASGETCAEIADLYGITVADLLRANRGINEDCTNLREGDNLRIPSAAATATAGPGTPTPRPSGQQYVVESGDTCADIAAAFGVSADEIIELNGLDPGCTTLQPGDVLQIP